MVEILVAASILAVAFIAVMGAAQRSIYLSRQGLHQAQAAFLLEEGGEAVRIFRNSGWSNITALNSGTTYYPTFAGGTWTLSTTPNTVGIFSRKVTVSSVNRDSSDNIATSGTADPGTKLITVTVSWLEGSQTVTKTLLFYLSDIFS